MQIDPAGLSPNQVFLLLYVYTLTCQLLLSPLLFRAFCLAHIDYIVIMEQSVAPLSVLVPAILLQEGLGRLADVPELERLYA